MLTLQLQNFIDSIASTDTLFVAEEILEAPQSGLALTFQELAEVDSRLPHAVDAILSYAQMKSADPELNSFKVSLLSDTVMHWDAARTIETTNEGTVPYLELLWFSYVSFEADPPHAMLGLRKGYVCEHSFGNNESLEFIAKYETGVSPVNLTWLDENFPQWRTRYSMAETLGLESEELLKTVLTTARQAAPIAVNVQDISFD